MKLLFVKLKNIGDALLMTPALTAARELFPEAQIDVLVREGTEGILRGSLALTNIYTSAAPETKRRARGQLFKDLALLGKLRKEKYDWVFELSDNNRGRTMSFLAGAKNRAAHTAYDFPLLGRLFFNKPSPLEYGTVHRCEKDVELLRRFLNYTGPTPQLQFDRSFVDWGWAQANITQAPIVIHPVTRWKRKMWPLEKWQALVKRLSVVAPIIVTSGTSPEEVELARQIASAAPERVSITEGKLSWPEMAGLLYSARMLVSVDTATMHLGAACQTPLVALFGPTLENQWAPWCCPHTLICAPMGPGLNPKERAVSEIDLEQVWNVCGKMLHTPVA